MLDVKFEERSADPRKMDGLYLQHIEIEIIGAERSIKGEAKQIAFWAATGFENLGAGFEGVTADLGSSGPVFIYKSTQAAIHLTEDKLKQFILRSLSPMDYFSLVQKVGFIAELDVGIYDEQTGEALAPIPMPAKKKELKGKAPRSKPLDTQGDLLTAH